MESTPAAQYQHTPFEDDRSIRLLYLQPGKFFDDINLTLVVANLDNLPPYCALSYAWGPPPHKTPVFCHGQELLVSKSCAAALRRLRSKIDVKTLWIDAICIDQTSLIERGHQVKLMCDVYSKATRTWIWLGECSQESDFVVDFLGRYCKILHATRELSSDFRDELLLLEIDKLKAEEMILYGEKSDKLVRSLCWRPWFKRVWTVQEYTLSRDAQVICGCKILPISNLLNGVMSLSRIRLKKGESNYVPSSNSFLAYYAQYSHIWDAIHANGKKPARLSELLAEGRQLDASDPRDVVFGLQGMLEKFQITMPLPDYGKSVKDIYIETTKVAIEGENSLNVLLHCSSTDTKFHLPSWVPDWSSYVYDGLRSLGSVENSSFYQSSGRIHASFKFSGGGEKLYQNQSVLTVKGITIDVLQYCAPDRYSEEQTWQTPAESVLDGEGPDQYLRDSAIYKVVEAWMEIAFELSPYPTGEPLLQAFSRTLIHDQYRMSSIRLIWPEFDIQNGFLHWLLSHQLGSAPLNGKIADALSSFSQKYKEGFSKDIEQEEAEITTAYKAKYVQRSVERSRYAVNIQFLIRNCIRGNLFFTTGNGYFGQGMPGVEPGDEVLLVAGVPRPLIARRIGARYRLIGQAYVHGVMDGEKWPEDESELVDIMFE